MGIRNKRTHNYILKSLLFLIPFIVINTQFKLHTKKNELVKEISSINTELKNNFLLSEKLKINQNEYKQLLQNSLIRYKDISLGKSITFVVIAIFVSLLVHHLVYQSYQKKYF